MTKRVIDLPAEHWQWAKIRAAVLRTTIPGYLALLVKQDHDEGRRATTAKDVRPREKTE